MMMEGVQVLSQSAISVLSFNSSVFFIVLISLIVVGLVFSILLDDNTVLYSMVIGGVIFGFIAGVLMPIKEETDVIEYKVIVSDEVNFKEFNEKYEIVGQEGEIYTIRDKEEN